MSANDPAATDTAAIIQGLRDELENFENIRLQNERQNEENLNSVSIFFSNSAVLFLILAISHPDGRSCYVYAMWIRFS